MKTPPIRSQEQRKFMISSKDSKIINQINKFGKSFSEMTIDTVKGFLQDSKKSKFKI